MKIKKIKILKNSKGYIYKIFSKNTSPQESIKELYFNEIKPKNETSWIRHKKSTCNIYLIHGSGKILTKDRKNKKRKVLLREFGNNQIIIKQKTWFKIVNVLNKKMIIMNFTDYAHNQKEYEKKDKI